MKKIFIIILIQIFTFIIAQESKGGLPYSIVNNFREDINFINMPQLNINQLIDEDNNRPPATPYRYGYKFYVDYSVDNSGQWIELENGDRIWQLAIYSSGAYAISLEYNHFFIPEGATFFVYNENQEMIYGAYTNENNQDDFLFSTPLVEGEIIYLEYYEPNIVFEQGIINIEYVIHDYKDILNFSQSRESRSCGENVVCNSADPYEDQINATSWLDMGGYICSGSMINNTSFDLTPYYWTAWHCVVGDNPSTFRFYFDYETTSCSGSWASNGPYEYGGTLLSSSNGMDPDYALILITDNTISDNIFYAGWDKSSSSPTISCGVHHPDGNPKKINYDNDTAYNSGPVNWGDPDYDGDDDISPSGSHWRITWDEGGTEGGSSGSPAYNSSGRLIGQLTGGSGDCNANTGQDYYGKFSRAFSEVSQWLDPLNANISQIDGTYDGNNSSDSDGDGVPDSEDSNDNNPYQCSDIDEDTCDDCSAGTYNIYDDGWDYDEDGICDAGDLDDDNDGVTDDNDSNDNNEFECSNNDGDSCDDCSSGYYNPDDDGCIYLSGDVNLDDNINIIDVVMLVNIIIGEINPTVEQLVVADLNNDNSINVSDIILLVNIIIN